MKAYFYKIISHNSRDDELDKCLDSLQKSFFHTEGHYEDCDGVGYRIEHFERSSDFCTGDFIRQQKDDIPPQAANGKPLKSSSVPLGHLTAFLYHYSTKVLIIQGNRSGVSPALILKFVREKLSHGGFEYMPILSKANVDDLLNGSIRKITVGFAAPENLAVLENDGSDLNNIDRMRRGFKAPSVQISFGFDSPKAGMLDNKAIASFIGKLYSSPMRTTKILAKQEGDELLDLLGKKHTYKEDISIDTNDMNIHYRKRKSFLERAFNSSKSFIESYFTNPKAA